MSSAQPSPVKPEEIAEDARWLTQALDPAAGQVRLVAMNRDSYRAASFLDDRIMQQPVDAHIVPWPTIEAAAAEIARCDARWIFHIGHVGSTLISRLLGEIPGVLAIREPRLLRDVALAPTAIRDRYLAPVARLMSRTFGEQEAACVKASSWVSEIASELVPSGERALFMFATPRNYVANILAGENSVKELRMLAVTRARRLASRMSAIGPPHGDAELAGIAWACEMTALEAAADHMIDRQIAWADFDRMLADMPAALRSTVDHFGFDAGNATVARIASGPLMSRYSKSLEFDYSADLRRDRIAEAEHLHGPQIERALAMLRSAAEKSPLLARALSRAEG